jgi:hypothetical protein
MIKDSQFFKLIIKTTLVVRRELATQKVSLWHGLYAAVSEHGVKENVEDTTSSHPYSRRPFHNVKICAEEMEAQSLTCRGTNNYCHIVRLVYVSGVLYLSELAIKQRFFAIYIAISR